MKLIIKLPNEAWKLLNEMASESKLTPQHLIEVATYNLIALYLRDKDEKSIVDTDPVSGDGVAGVFTVVDK